MEVAKIKFSFLVSKLIKKIHLPAVRNSKIDITSKICSGSHVVDLTLKRYSYIGNFCTVINSEIGQFCSIADNCIIGGANHPIDWVSTSPVFHDSKNIMHKNFSEHEFKLTNRTIIGNDVWIGNNCLIKSGLNISDGAIIGMGSVVTKNVGPYEIWAGNPAKLIKPRFEHDIISIMLDIKWWNWSLEELEKNAADFNKILKFINNHNIKEV